jgi:hypothetical protein
MLTDKQQIIYTEILTWSIVYQNRFSTLSYLIALTAREYKLLNMEVPTYNDLRITIVTVCKDWELRGC